MAKNRTATKIRSITNGGVPTSVATDLRQEVVAGNRYGYGGKIDARVLPESNDRLTTYVSREIYSLMTADPEVNKCLNVLVTSVLSDGETLVPSILETMSMTPDEENDLEQAIEIKEFCRRSFDQMKKPLRLYLEGMLRDALGYGHSIAEKNWRYETEGQDAGKLMLDSIKTKPRGLARFVVDRFFNIFGIVGTNPIGNSAIPEFSTGFGDFIPTQDLTIGGNSETGFTINGLPIFPREKFAILTIQSQNEDPRGISTLKAAFEPWMMKRETWPQLLRYISLCALPIIAGFTDPNNPSSGKQFQKDRQGNYVKDQLTGRPSEVSSTIRLESELLKLAGGSTIALPGGYSIETIEAKGNGKVILDAIALYDRQIETGILNNVLATSDSAHSTRAASQTHMSVMDQLIFWLKNLVADMVRTQILTDMVFYNFGSDAAQRFVPIVHFGDTERRDFAKDGVALSSMGYKLDPSQFKQLDQLLGVPVRENISALDFLDHIRTSLAVDPTHIQEFMNELSSMAAGMGIVSPDSKASVNGPGAVPGPKPSPTTATKNIARPVNAAKVAARARTKSPA